MTETVWLQRPGEDVPWGFRLSGGVDCDKPLTVQRVSPGSIASTGLQVGDAILKIGEYETAGLTQTQSQDIIKTSGNLLQILISKQGGIISNPQTPQTPQSALIQMEQPPLHQQPHPEQQQQLPPMTPETPQVLPPSWTPGGMNDPFEDMNTSAVNNPERPPVGRYFCAPISCDPSNNVYTYKPDFNQPYSNQTAGTFPRNYDSGIESPNSSHSSQITNNVDPYRPFNTNPASESFTTGFSSPHSYNPSNNDTNTGYTEITGDQPPPDYSMAYQQGRKPEPWEETAYQEYYQKYSSQGNDSKDDLEKGSSDLVDSMHSSRNDHMYDYVPTHYDNNHTNQNQYTDVVCNNYQSLPLNNDSMGILPDDKYKLNHGLAPESSKPDVNVLYQNKADVPSILATSPDNTTRDISDTVQRPIEQSEELPCVPLPPPAPPLPQTNDYKNASPKASPKFANRLEEQLAGMSMNNYQPPNYSYETDNSYSSPPAPGAPGPTFKPFGATNSSTPTSPYNAPPAPPMPQPGQTAKIPARDQPQVPDAIVNMASKGSPDKKPWAYAPDMNIIQQQREKVRRRGKEPSTPEHTRGAGVIPHYQHMLNMPSFDDSPPKSKPNSTPSTPVTPGVSVTTPEGEEGEVEDVLVKHAQFNSPLNLYSENNVKDAFSYQTQGPDGPTNVKPIERQSSTSSSKDGKDVPMSPVYRMIHGLDEEKPRAPRVPSTTAQKRGTTEPRKEETTFEGLNRTEIPSKSFQRLQQYTDTNTIDTSSIRHNVNPDANDDGIGDYAQASIRYMGRNIPSKSFRMLQSLTGGADDTPVAPPQRRMRKPVAPPSPDTNPDEGVDIAYVGGAIPSKSFRMLQNSVGESEAPSMHPTHANNGVPQNVDPHGGSGIPNQTTTLQNSRGRTVKVIQLRSPPKPQKHDDHVTDF